MPDCRYCEQSFDGEPSYREHLYHEHDREDLGRIDEKRVEQTLDTLTRKNTAAIEESLQCAPTSDTIRQALKTYTHVLWKTLEWEDFETLRELVRRYYEPVVTCLDTAVKAEGWPVLAEMIDTYDPRLETPPPGVSPIVANVVGRYVIRTRVSAGADSIPAEALDYLQVFADRELPIEGRQPVAVPKLSPGYLEWEESYAYGWGIGPPDHEVAARIHDVARSSEPEWSQLTLEQAFYADQYAAADLLARMLHDSDVTSRLLCLRAVPFEESEVTIHTRYWDWRDDCTPQFDLAPDVVTRLQHCLTASDLGIEMPDDVPLDNASDP